MNDAAGWLKTHFDYEFSDESLLERALTHRSAAGRNNERMEFLGDSVLNFVASTVVFESHRNASEGDLSRLRASLVKDATLADIAQEIGLGERLILGEGERKSGGFRRRSILADALEAILGAIYLDSGFEQAQAAVRHLLAHRISNLPDVDQLKDPKTRLQELLQAEGRDLPEYVTEEVSGKAHRQTFEVSCSVPALALRTLGRGSSRRAAEQAAAQRLLDELAAGAGPSAER